MGRRAFLNIMMAFGGISRDFSDLGKLRFDRTLKSEALSTLGTSPSRTACKLSLALHGDF